MRTVVKKALTDPKIAARIAELGSTPIVMSPSDYGAFLVAETEKWAKVVRFLGRQGGLGRPGRVRMFGPGRRPALRYGCT